MPKATFRKRLEEGWLASYCLQHPGGVLTSWLAKHQRVKLSLHDELLLVHLRMSFWLLLIPLWS